MEIQTDYGCTGKSFDSLMDRIRPVMAVSRVSPGVWIIIRKPDEVWMITQGEHSIDYKSYDYKTHKGVKKPRSAQTFYLNRIRSIRSVHYRLTKTYFWE